MLVIRNVPIQAYLIHEIIYIKDGIEILVPKGTSVLFDEIDQSGLIAGDHIQMTSDEVKQLYMN